MIYVSHVEYNDGTPSEEWRGPKCPQIEGEVVLFVEGGAIIVIPLHRVKCVTISEEDE